MLAVPTQPRLLNVSFEAPVPSMSMPVKPSRFMSSLPKTEKKVWA